MGYVIAAYGVTLATLGGYAIHLLRERARLSRVTRATGGTSGGPPGVKPNSG